MANILTVANYAIVQIKGGRRVGYRVWSNRGIMFRPSLWCKNSTIKSSVCKESLQAEADTLNFAHMIW